MAEAAVHSSASLLASLIGALPMAIAYDGWHAVLFSLTCLLGEHLFSPDLDHNSGARPYRRWGWLRIIWWLYQRLIPHRSPLSHWPILGTIGRIVYLVTLAMPAIVYFEVDVAGIVFEYETVSIAVMTGLEASNTTHWLFDTILR